MYIVQFVKLIYVMIHKDFDKKENINTNIRIPINSTSYIRL